MMRRIPAVFGWLALSLRLATYAVALAMFSATSAGAPAVPPQLIAFVAFPIVGALIVTQRPRNTVGWLFCALQPEHVSLWLASRADGRAQPELEGKAPA